MKKSQNSTDVSAFEVMVINPWVP